MKLQEKLQNLKKDRKAILACNYYNFETLKGVCIAVSQKNMPVILQLTRSSIEYMGLFTALQMGRAALKQYRIDGWIHLDHGDSEELVYKCLEAGFDSVMIDASERPFEENIEITSKVVRYARKFESNVEAELGFVAKLGQSSEGKGFTCPQEAQVFAEETGVDALAVAIGTAHGFYKEDPKLDLARLDEISRKVTIPLVLHGGSGIPADILKEAVNRGICKINIATEIKDTFMRSLTGLLKETSEIDLRKVFPPAITEVNRLVQQKLDIVR
jgi:tagatose 1,6-diphosphate aldolase GatY/KbaY